MAWAASGCISVRNTELRVSVLVEAVSLGSLLVEILVVNIGTGHPYLTVLFGISQMSSVSDSFREHSPVLP